VLLLTSVGRVLRLSLVTVLVALLATRSSAANSPNGDQLIQEGLELRREGKDADALEKFQRAHEQTPSARALAQIALAEQALGRWVDAEAHLDLVLEMKDPWLTERRSLLTKALAEVRTKLGTLEVHANQKGAEVFVDGSRKGTIPLAPMRMSTGTHEVVLTAKGSKRTVRTVRVKGNATTLLDVELTPDRDSRVTEARQNRPKTERPTPSGDATRASTDRPASWQRTAAWIALASAGALLIGSVTAHVIREREAALYNDDSRCLRGTLSRLEACGDNKQAAETAQTFAVVGYVATGITLGASIALFATDSSRQTHGGFMPVPRSHSGAILGWSGAF